MLHHFASAEWVNAVKEAINTHDGYRESAKTWEGDFWFVIEPDQSSGDAPVLIYLDLWPGTCRTATLAHHENENMPKFRISGIHKNWLKRLCRESDPIRALMTNTLRLKGNMAKVMRNIRTAQDLVLAAAMVPMI